MSVLSLRIKHGMTRQQLAEASGVSLNTVANAERGTKEPTLATVRALAEALGVETAVMLEAVAASQDPGDLAANIDTIAEVLAREGIDATSLLRMSGRIVELERELAEADASAEPF